MNALDEAFLKCRAMKIGAVESGRTGAANATARDRGPRVEVPWMPILRCADQVRWPQVVERVLHCAADRFGHVAEELFQSAGDGAARIALTSSVRQEGRTTLALATARWIADHFSGKKVLLVDADVLQTTLTELLDTSAIDSADSGGSSNAAADSLVESGGLAVLGVASTMLPLNGEAMAQWKSAIEFLQTHFDIVLFDSGPVAEERLAKACVEELAQAAVWLRDPSRVSLEAFRHAQQQLSIPCLGVIENLVPRQTVHVTEQERTLRFDASESSQTRAHRDVPRQQPHPGALNHV